MTKKILFICLVSLFCLFSSAKVSAQAIDSVDMYGGCYWASIWIYADTTLNVHMAVDFGDGTSDTLFTDSSGIYPFYHAYPWPGTYPVVITMFQNSSVVDTMHLSYTRDTNSCAYTNNRFWYDLNNDCVKNNNEPYTDFNVVLEVALNSVPIDTVSVQNGNFYFTYGNLGDIYTFKVISIPPDVVVTCPLSGSIDDTLNFGQPFVNWFAFNCANTSAFDFGLHPLYHCSHPVGQNVHMYVTNPLCDDPAATYTFTHSNKYQYTGSASPPPTSVAGNVLTWNLSGLGASGTDTEIPINVNLTPVGTLNMGDTVHSYFSVAPTTGDADPTNNTLFVIDTITASYDPNAIYVKPGGCVSPGTNLEYTITFENLGNGPAQNVYVLDTLPAGLDWNSFKVQFSSHDMFVGYREIGPYTILKFDFPDIMLADSSDHVGRCGGLMYTIDSKNTLPLGYMIDHRVGIYFDTNPVVLTNTASTGICWLATENIAMNSSDVEIYPNPATESITVKAKGFDYDSYTISNCIGQTVSSGSLLSHNTKINLHQIPAGLYYLALSGRSGTVVHKFQKL
ncbi:MAG TPA: T9SS type A sorting domain-containing protein [Flavipsychrobacter sp.]|nr:T9SS type A sorting domain-containing protein [Flavipsychrobacter sp.]